jgi:hypothetical protein
MNDNFKKALEETVPGLTIDGTPTVADGVAIAQKVIEVGIVVAGSVVANHDGKVDVADVSGVVKASMKLSPTSAKKAFFEGLKEEIRESKTKWDDVMLPVISALQKFFGAN